MNHAACAQSPLFSTVFNGGAAVNSQAGATMQQQVVDAAGNVYLAGSFMGTITLDTQTLTSVGASDILVVKMSPAGTLLWAKQAGSSGDNGATSLALDAAGNLLVAGYFTSTITFGGLSVTSTGFTDAFVLKCGGNGQLQWLMRGGGALGDDVAASLSLDGAGQVYLAGKFTGRTTTFGTFTLTNKNSGGEDILVIKLDSAGNVLWAVGAGGYYPDEAYGIAVDSAGNSYITGYYESTSAQFGAYTLAKSAGSSGDVFVAKLDANGTFLWATSAGGTADDRGTGIAVDAQGRAYVIGFLLSGQAAFGTITLSSPNTNYNAFVGKLTPTGNWEWAVEGGGPGDDFGAAIALDAAGNVYVTGSFSYQGSFGSTTLQSGGDKDVFICRLNSAGVFQWALRAGGTDEDRGTNLCVTSGGDVIVTGFFCSSLAFFGQALALYNPGARSSFVARITNTPLAVLQPQAPIALAVWPNPVRGENTIHVTGASTSQPAQVLDLLGRVVVIGPGPVAGGLTISLPEELASGSYLLRVGQQTCRFVLSR